MMFHWGDVEVLKQYRTGDIFVEASTIEEAREIALRDFDRYLRTRYDWLFYDGEPLDESAREDLAEKVAALRRGLKKAPSMTTKGAIFIEGSE